MDEERDRTTSHDAAAPDPDESTSLADRVGDAADRVSEVVGGAVGGAVNLAVGGKWPEAPTDPSAFPAVLAVDYIRVWQKQR